MGSLAKQAILRNHANTSIVEPLYGRYDTLAQRIVRDEIEAVEVDLLEDGDEGILRLLREQVAVSRVNVQLAQAHLGALQSDARISYDHVEPGQIRDAAVILERANRTYMRNVQEYNRAKSRIDRARVDSYERQIIWHQGRIVDDEVAGFMRSSGIKSPAEAYDFLAKLSNSLRGRHEPDEPNDPDESEEVASDSLDSENPIMGAECRQFDVTDDPDPEAETCPSYGPENPVMAADHCQFDVTDDPDPEAETCPPYGVGNQIMAADHCQFDVTDDPDPEAEAGQADLQNTVEPPANLAAPLPTPPRRAKTRSARRKAR